MKIIVGLDLANFRHLSKFKQGVQNREKKVVSNQGGKCIVQSENNKIVTLYFTLCCTSNC